LQTLQTILLVAPVLLFSVIAHEIAHGFAALRQGDRTALDAGRLSWNPLRHIDFFLTILLPIITFTGSSLAGGQPMMFGGAKPVPVDPRNYRHPKRGDIIVSLAGVATNLLLAAVAAGLTYAFGALGNAAPSLAPSMAILQAMFLIGVLLNLALIAFNLIPIPPLDGSHVFKYLLPPALSLRYQRLGFAGLFILVLLLNTRLFAWWMSPVYFAFLALEHQLRAGGFLLPAAARLLQ
jgi:Zn-dependent protease